MVETHAGVLFVLDAFIPFLSAVRFCKAQESAASAATSPVAAAAGKTSLSSSVLRDQLLHHDIEILVSSRTDLFPFESFKVD